MSKNLFLVLVTLVVLTTSCSDKTEIVEKQTSGLFTQEFNPKYLDVLWVIDDRSPLFPIKTQLVSEAKNFFKRLAGLEELSYRMAFTSSDMQFNQGKLKPVNYILTGNSGNINERADLFASLLTSQFINLSTGAESKGFEAAWNSLNLYFKSSSDVPLVVIFISDSDDHSLNPSNSLSAVDFYSQKFLSLKQKSDLIRVYSINYLALKAGDDADAMRCATRYSAEIDISPSFEDRYFKLADKMGGKTANLCSSNWSNEIDLTGLRLKELSKRFKLDQKAKPGTISVSIVKNGSPISVPNWTFDSSSNEIVFDSAPESGGVIQVSFVPL